MKPIALVFILTTVAFPRDDDSPAKKGVQPPDGLKALKHTDPAVRYKSVVLLGNLGPVAKFAVADLRDTLKDENPWVRVRAAEALWKIDKTSPFILVPVLVQALKEKNADLRATVPEVIGLLGPKAKSAVPALVDALKDKESKVQAAAVLALGEIGPPAKDAAPALLDLVKGTDPVVEFLVSGTLSRLGPSVVPLLCKTLTDKLVDRRLTAAAALALMDPPPADAVTALAEALGDGEETVRAASARALGKIGPAAKDALPKLRGALKEASPFTRLDAALSLHQIDASTDQLSVVIAILAGMDAKERSAACQVLGQIGPAAKDAVPTLVLALAAREALLRQAAAEALGKIGPAAAKSAPALKDALKDADDFVRPHAALALWRVTGKTDKALATLKTELTAKDLDARRAAARALSDMGQAARPAFDLLADRYQEVEEDYLVRTWIAEALKKIDPAAARKLGIR